MVFMPISREKLLVVVRPGTAHEEHGHFPSHRDLALHPHLDHFRHFLGDDCLDTLDQFRVFEVVGYLSKRLCSRFRPDEIDLDPGDAELGLHHFRHIVDRAVAHDGVEIRCVGVGELVVCGIAAEGGDNGDAAVIHDAVDFKRVPADVVLAEQVDLVLAFFDVVIEANHVRENTVVGYVVARGLAHALVALATEPENVDPELFLHLSGYGCTSSPMSPTGQVAKMLMALGLNRSYASWIAARSFFSPPKTMSSSCMSVEKQ